MVKEEQVAVSLIRRGGVFFNIPGNTVNEIYKNMLKKIKLPPGIDRDALCEELFQREALISTACGNGIAVPHPRKPFFTDETLQQITVCYPDKPVNMNQPDSRPVYALFLLLTAKSEIHLKVLSYLMFAFQKKEFREILERKPGEADLLAAFKKFVQ